MLNGCTAIEMLKFQALKAKSAFFFVTKIQNTSSQMVHFKSIYRALNRNLSQSKILSKMLPTQSAQGFFQINPPLFQLLMHFHVLYSGAHI